MSLLLGATRPAFADGVPMSYDGLFVMAGGGVALGIVVLLMILRAIGRVIARRDATRAAELPRAREVPPSTRSD